MSDTLRTQIYNNLIIKNTEELLEIWQNGDTSEWNEEVFEFIKEILIKRLGYLPTQSHEAQARQILQNVEEHIDNDEPDKALSECELAIQLDPNFALAYNYRGEIYEQLGQLENAITSYQRAIQVDPELKDAWENMVAVESEMQEEFEVSLT
jgi:tetratricopeptide (TPR) repeat protein